MAEVFTETGVAATFVRPKSKRSNNQNNRPRLSKEEREQRHNNAVERLQRTVDFDGGKFVVWEDENGIETYGIVVAGIEKDRKLYIAYLDDTRHVQLHTIGDKYRIAREIPAKYSVIDYLVRMERNSIRELVEDEIEQMKDADGWQLVTEIGLKEFRPRPAGKKKFKNNRKTSKK